MRIVVAGILEREGPGGARQVLVGARSSPAWAAGQWEFPGGKVEGGETLAQALVREWREELGAEVDVLGEVYRNELNTPVGNFLLVALRVRLLSDEPRPLEHSALAWVAPADLTRLRLLPSNVPIAEALNTEEGSTVTGA
jgi:mutator protein MutT